MNTQLQGTITAGNTVVPLDYGSSNLLQSTVESGAQLLNAALLATTPPMVVFGHALGAVVGANWLNNYGPTSIIDPADLSFVFIGNSGRPYGGYAYVIDFFTGSITPPGTPYTVQDLARQYDGFADYPTGVGGGFADAKRNAVLGQGSIHPDYKNVNLVDNGAGIPNVAHAVGNISYIWSMTQPLPIYGTTWNSYTSSLDYALRPSVESAYSRPVTVPSPYSRAVNLSGNGLLV